MKRILTKGLILSLALFALIVVGLAWTPHRSCACGEYSDGSHLTHLINSVAEETIGQPLIAKKPRPSY